MHDEATGKADSRIDLNRTGTPLLEIVTQPDMRSPQEARVFLAELKLLLSYLGVSDCNMQEGSLRVDANVNLHVSTPAGTVATPIVEVKNMNSFRAVERALVYEAERQSRVWRETGQQLGDVPKQTRGWDDQAEITRSQRHKEESSDYRYFPDPDLVPVVIKPDQVEQIRSELGELPAAIRSRLESDYGIEAYDADVLVNQGRAVVDYFETVARLCGQAKRASNWVQQDVLRTLNEQNIALADFRVPSESLAELLTSIEQGVLDGTRARDVFQEMASAGTSVSEAMRQLGISKVDQSSTVALCREILQSHPHVIAEVKGGKEKAIGALVGQAKKRNPNVNPAEVKSILLQLIGQS
jgi:aspartyl-tRNA(Asn)/glutamyl-tRNA(Gln) amidotransferase subunit B